MRYLIWHYTKGLVDFLRIWRNFFQFFWRWFLVPQLLRHLLSTWRHDITSYGEGFSPKRFAEALILNTASRLIGFCVRLILLAVAAVLELLIALLGLAFFLYWLGFVLLEPLFVLLGLYFILQGALAIGIFYLVWGILFLNLAYFAFGVSERPDYATMDFDQLLRQKWARRVWRRLGLKKTPRDFAELTALVKNLDLTQNDLGLLWRWEIFWQTQKEVKKYFWRRETLLCQPPLTRNLTYGFTYWLDKYSVDLTRLYRVAERTRILAHTQEVEKIENILASSGEANVLLLGDPGSGKSSTVMSFAKKIAQGMTFTNLAFKRVLDFHVDEALAGLPDKSAMEEQLNKLLAEAARAGNIILIIEDLDHYATKETGLGKIDLSAVLTAYLPYPTIQVVGTTSFSAYRQQLQQNQALMKYFERVEITEPNFDQVFFILCDFVFQLEQESKMIVSYQAIKRITQASQRYFQEIPLPQRALNLLKDVINRAQREGVEFIGTDLVDAVISAKAGIAVGAIKKDEQEKLVNLEKILHQRVINQQEAINEIASAMRRRRLEIGDTTRPIGSFLFLGPTGVGKTETAKALAQAYFGNEQRMIRLDMTEYKEVDALERLLGNATGSVVGQLTSAIREKPFSLLLLDEIGKANPDVVQIFMQVLEEGFLTDGLGRRVSFKESIIIATSNAGAEMIRELVKANSSLVQKKGQVLDFVQKEGIFKPELLNRFDSVVLYEPLSKENLLKVAGLMLAGLQKRLLGQQLIFEFSGDLVQKVVEIGYDPQYGARPMRRAIQQKVEDLIAKKMLAGKIQKNQPFTIRAEEI